MWKILADFLFATGLIALVVVIIVAIIVFAAAREIANYYRKD